MIIYVICIVKLYLSTKVDININNEPVDLHMKLGEGGEAFFVQPCQAGGVPHYLCTSPIPEDDAEALMGKSIAKLKKEIKVSG